MGMYGTELEAPEFGGMGESFEGGSFEGESFEGESYEGGFHETQQEDEQFLGDILGSVLGGEVGSPLSEAQEIELAAELLEISSEEELEQFLGNLIKSAGGFIRSPAGQALAGIGKNLLKKALPGIGGALGSFVAPGVGTAIGSKLGSMASGMFEIELEAMPQEHAEFEAARRMAGLSAAAARNVAAARPRPGISPQTVARAAVAKAAQTYAPGVARQMTQSLRATARPGMGTSARYPQMPSGGYHPSAASQRLTAAGYPRPGPAAGQRPPAGGYPRPGPAAGQRPPAAGYPQPGLAAGQRPGAGGYPRPGPTVPQPPAAPVPPQVPGGQPSRHRWPNGVRYAYWPGYAYGDSEPGYDRPPTEEPQDWGEPADAMDAGGLATSGRWVRRGRKIVLIGA